MYRWKRAGHLSSSQKLFKDASPQLKVNAQIQEHRESKARDHMSLHSRLALDVRIFGLQGGAEEEGNADAFEEREPASGVPFRVLSPSALEGGRAGRRGGLAQLPSLVDLNSCSAIERRWKRKVNRQGSGQ